MCLPVSFLIGLSLLDGNLRVPDPMSSNAGHIQCPQTAVAQADHVWTGLRGAGIALRQPDVVGYLDWARLAQEVAAVFLEAVTAADSPRLGVGVSCGPIPAPPGMFRCARFVLRLRGAVLKALRGYDAFLLSAQRARADANSGGHRGLNSFLCAGCRRFAPWPQGARTCFGVVDTKISMICADCSVSILRYSFRRGWQRA